MQEEQSSECQKGYREGQLRDGVTMVRQMRSRRERRVPSVQEANCPKTVGCMSMSFVHSYHAQKERWDGVDCS